MGLSDGKQRGVEVPEEGGGARLPGFAIMVSQRFNMNIMQHDHDHVANMVSQ